MVIFVPGAYFRMLYNNEAKENLDFLHILEPSIWIKKKVDIYWFKVMLIALAGLGKYQEIEKIVVFGIKLTFLGLIPSKQGKIPWMCLLVLNWRIIPWYWFLSSSAYLIKYCSTDFWKSGKMVFFCSCDLIQQALRD